MKSGSYERFDSEGSITPRSARVAAREAIHQILERALYFDNEEAYDTVGHLLQTSYGNRNTEYERDLLDSAMCLALVDVKSAIDEALWFDDVRPASA